MSAPRAERAVDTIDAFCAAAHRKFSEQPPKTKRKQLGLSETDARDVPAELSLGRSQDGRQRYMSSGSSGGEGNAAEEEGALTAEDLELPPQQQGTTPARDSFHYFQAADGQAVFLHALNVRMLARDYGALEHSPHSFTARIVEIEGASIDEVCVLEI